MFQCSKALFLYCISPVHMGAGSAVGVVDNPIQRERHTHHPVFAGSGLKGAMRHACSPLGWKPEWITRLFGPDAGQASDHAGAVSVGDAQLVAFPVRCTRGAFVYVTSPIALGRAGRLLKHLGVEIDWHIPEVAESGCVVVPETGLAKDGQALHLEVFEHMAKANSDFASIARWLAENALPQDDGYAFFRKKLETDLVLLPEDDFCHYVTHATIVEPHVRINDETGTADSGGLFYTENLPPESLLLAPVMTSPERRARQENDKRLEDGTSVMNLLLNGPQEGGDDGSALGFNGRLMQVGGDATTGRGQVMLTAVDGK